MTQARSGYYGRARDRLQMTGEIIEILASRSLRTLSSTVPYRHDCVTGSYQGTSAGSRTIAAGPHLCIAIATTRRIVHERRRLPTSNIFRAREK